MQVIDEADRILEIGFEEEMRQIVRVLPKDRQTMLFSATQTTKAGGRAGGEGGAGGRAAGGGFPCRQGGMAGECTAATGPSTVVPALAPAPALLRLRWFRGQRRPRVCPRNTPPSLRPLWRCRRSQVEDLARLSFKRKPLYVGIDDSKAVATREGLEQGYCVVPADKRFLLLFTFLKKNANKKVGGVARAGVQASRQAATRGAGGSAGRRAGRRCLGS